MRRDIAGQARGRKAKRSGRAAKRVAPKGTYVAGWAHCTFFVQPERRLLDLNRCLGYVSFCHSLGDASWGHSGATAGAHGQRTMRAAPQRYSAEWPRPAWPPLVLAGIAGPAHAIFFGSSDDRYPYQASAPAPAPAITRQAKPKPPADSLRHKLNIERAEAKRPNELKAKAGQGPLLLVISIDQQKLVLYSNGEAIAESKVSTGVETHPTPTGIFSIIQRNRWHRSNIYSNAPMPYMQRITWSGVALHEGIVPGRPASHGCIRLPQAFAQQLWGTTKLGARVIVTRGEVTPVEFNHPRLAALTRKSDPLITKQKDDAPKPAGETSTPGPQPRADLSAPVRLQSAREDKNRIGISDCKRRSARRIPDSSPLIH